MNIEQMKQTLSALDQRARLKPVEAPLLTLASQTIITQAEEIERLRELAPRWREGLPKEAGLYLVEKPYSQYLAFAVAYFDGYNFDSPSKYIGRWMPIPKGEGE